MASKIIQLSDGTDNLFPTLADIPIVSGADLNDCMTVGIWNCYSSAIAATLINSPVSNAGFPMLVLPVGATTARIQVIFAGNAIYMRRRTSTSWGSWNTIQ